MAIYNEILAARYARMLQKLFSMKGPVPAKQLAGEIQPVFPFFAGAELRILEGWNLFGFTVTAGPVAAQNSACRFRNPSNSGVIAVVTRISFQPGAADTVNLDLGAQTADLATVTVPGPWDPRSTFVGSTIITSQSTNVAAFGTNIWKGNILAQDTPIMQYEGQEIPILPGQALQGRTTTVNNAVVMNVWWRERVLEDSEKAS